MTRDWLNAVPDSALAVIFIAGAVIIALVSIALVLRFLAAWREERSSQTIAGVVAMVMTIFALVLAFVIVNLYNSYESAVNNVTAEATSLIELVQYAREFPPAGRHPVEAAVARYVVEVRDHEFHQLRIGHDDPHAQQLLANLFSAVESYSPVTPAQQSFYEAATQQLHTIVTHRESRLDAAETSIPKPLLDLMILLAILTFVMALLIKTHSAAVDVAIVVTIAVVIGAGLLTAMILQYPFSGSIAVANDPFKSSALAQLTQKYD